MPSRELYVLTSFSNYEATSRFGSRLNAAPDRAQELGVCGHQISFVSA